jgi:hypothetical protein
VSDTTDPLRRPVPSAWWHTTFRRLPGAEPTSATADPGLSRYVADRLARAMTPARISGGAADLAPAVTETVTALLRAAVVEPATPVSVTADVLVDHVRARAARRADGAGLGDLRRGAYGSGARTALVALVEEWQFMRGTAHHVALAATRAPAPVAAALRAYGVEEADHPAAVRAGLSAALPADELDRRRPLPGTRALLALFATAATSSTVAYLVLGAACEGGAGDVDALRTEFDLLAGTGLAPSIWEPFRAHALLDAACGHSDLFGSLLTGLEPLEPADVATALGAADDLADCVVGYFGSIVAAPGLP